MGDAREPQGEHVGHQNATEVDEQESQGLGCGRGGRQLYDAGAQNVSRQPTCIRSCVVALTISTPVCNSGWELLSLQGDLKHLPSVVASVPELADQDKLIISRLANESESEYPHVAAPYFCRQSP